MRVTGTVVVTWERVSVIAIDPEYVPKVSVTGRMFTVITLLVAVLPKLIDRPSQLPVEVAVALKLMEAPVEEAMAMVWPGVCAPGV